MTTTGRSVGAPKALAPERDKKVSAPPVLKIKRKSGEAAQEPYWEPVLVKIEKNA